MTRTKGWTVEDLSKQYVRIPPTIKLNLISRHLTNRGMTLDDVIEAYRGRMKGKELQELTGLKKSQIYFILEKKHVSMLIPNKTISVRGGKVTKPELIRRKVSTTILPEHVVVPVAKTPTEIILYRAAAVAGVAAAVVGVWLR